MLVEQGTHRRQAINRMLAATLVALPSLSTGCVGPIPERSDIEIRTVMVDSTRWSSSKGGTSLCIFVREMERELRCVGRYMTDLGRLRQVLDQPVTAEIGVYNREIWQLAVRDSMIISFEQAVAASRASDARWRRNWILTFIGLAVASAIAVFQSPRKRRDD
ncbi:MAG: hypothetical protein ACT4P6_20555 [Gemmatimonadaceae bacterium]